MKLFVIASLIAVCAAGRLDHLERSYLPPDNSITSKQRGYGPSFDVGSSFAQQQGHPQNSFPNAANRYLPPASAAATNVASHYYGFAAKGLGGSRHAPSANQQYSIPSTSYGTPQGPTSINGAPSRQYLTPSLNTKQNVKFVAPVRQYVTPNAGLSQNGHQQLGVSHSQQQNYGAATSRQYLTPNASPSQNGPQQFGRVSGGEQQHFGAATSRQYLTPNASPIQNGQQQFGRVSSSEQQNFVAATSRQYLTPNASPSQNAQEQFGRIRGGPQQNLGAATSRQYLTPNTVASQSNARQQLGASNNFQQQRYGAAPSRQYLSPLPVGTKRIGQHKFQSLNYGQQQKYEASANPQFFVPAPGIQKQYSDAQKQYLAPLTFPKSGNTQFKSMIGTKSIGDVGRTYLAPNTNSFDGIPQQLFNERTGYQY